MRAGLKPMALLSSCSAVDLSPATVMTCVVVLSSLVLTHPAHLLVFFGSSYFCALACDFCSAHLGQSWSLLLLGVSWALCWRA